VATSYRQIGRRQLRLEDEALLKGQARFVDDLKFAGTLEAAYVRSPHAHARIAGIDAAAAKRAPGVHAVFTLDDLRPYIMDERMPLQFRSSELPDNITPFVLAKDEVSFAGEAVAIVIADNRYVAEDAAALVAVDYRPLPSVSDCRRASEPDAPHVHSARESNVLLRIRQSYGDIEGAFTRAAHHGRIALKQHRGGAHSIEGRGAAAVYDANEDRLTLWSSTQLAHEARAFLMRLLARDENGLRVVAPEVGGGFGAKFVLYPEEVAVAASCLALRCPIKWIEDRREHFLAAVQERDQYWDLEFACDGEGRIAAVRGRVIHDQGAYTPQGVNLPYNASTALPGPYIVPAYEITVDVVETNKVATMPIRGAGYPEGAFAMERILDAIARALKLDRADVRRRNLVPREKMPFTTPLKVRSGAPITLDSGDFHACLDAALEATGYDGFRRRQTRARAGGRLIGIGIGAGAKGTGRGPFESGIVRIGRSGRISVYSGAMPMGQGIKTALAQVCAEQFDVAPDEVTVVAGDTAVIPYGQGGFASRQTVTAGSAVHLAAAAVREKALEVAAHLLKTDVAALEIREGRVGLIGSNDPRAGVSLREIAEAVSGVPGYAMPGGFEPGLESLKSFMPKSLTYGLGIHAVEVEVDPETAGVAILNYVVVNDCGTMVNPLIVEGQLIGGAAHGIGNALMELMAYDENAQPLTTNFADYLMPSATETPRFSLKLLEYPSPLNPLGVKGVGEAGCVPAAAAIVSAIEDALSPFGIIVDEVPLTPACLARLLQASRSTRIGPA
jgi:carbon-monoxide dehydrogenase large subunit